MSFTYFGGSPLGASFYEKFCFVDLVTRYFDKHHFKGMENDRKDETSLWICITAGCVLMPARKSAECVHKFCACARTCVHKWVMSCTSNRASRPPGKLLFPSWGRFFKLFGHQLQKCKKALYIVFLILFPIFFKKPYSWCFTTGCKSKTPTE